MVDYGTIHKKTLCLRQKYPQTWSCLPNPVYFTDFKFFGSSFIKAMISKWRPFFILSDFCSTNLGLKKIKIKRASSDRRIFFKRITQPLTFSLKKSVKLKHRIKRWMNFKKECIFEIPGKFCIITSRWMFWVFLSQTKCLFVNRVCAFVLLLEM